MLRDGFQQSAECFDSGSCQCIDRHHNNSRPEKHLGFINSCVESLSKEKGPIVFHLFVCVGTILRGLILVVYCNCVSLHHNLTLLPYHESKKKLYIMLKWYGCQAVLSPLANLLHGSLNLFQRIIVLGKHCTIQYPFMLDQATVLHWQTSYTYCSC